MRIGQYEKAILELLFFNDGQIYFTEIKEKFTGRRKLRWSRFDTNFKKHEAIHKTLARATKTLEEKGLIERTGYSSGDGGLSKILHLKLLNSGLYELVKRDPTVIKSYYFDVQFSDIHKSSK